MMLRAILFDFGGVLAEEGFVEGMKAIAKRNGLDPEDFYRISSDLVYQTGYITGGDDEHSYWNALREKTGIKGDDQDFREEILRRFKLRPEMMAMVKELRFSGCIVAILSDQTNWLDELDRRTPFHHHFDHVFNSFHLGKTKRDPSIFRDVCNFLGALPGEVLFVDDNSENVKRATSQGLTAIHFEGAREFRAEMNKFIEREQPHEKSNDRL